MNPFSMPPSACGSLLNPSPVVSAPGGRAARSLLRRLSASHPLAPSPSLASACPTGPQCAARAAAEFPGAPAEMARPISPGLDPSLVTVPPPPHPTFSIHCIVRQALDEDLGSSGDVTSLATIPPETQAQAQFLAKADGILAGVAVADAVFREVDPTLQASWSKRDGDAISKGEVFATVAGSARGILAAERVSLNLLQRMSGIATATKAMADAARPARLLETRKTVPGLRVLDKWAVLIGGGENHRMGLYDMLMIKDNHIAAAGGIPQAVAAAAEYLREKGLDLDVEVEARTLAEVQQVLECRGRGRGRVTRVMLDNMTAPREDGTLDTSLLKEAVALVGGEIETEASGNVTLETVHAIGSTGVTFISSGALTHSVKALDISLNIDTDLALEVGRRSKRT